MGYPVCSWCGKKIMEKTRRELNAPTKSIRKGSKIYFHTFCWAEMRSLPGKEFDKIIQKEFGV